VSPRALPSVVGEHLVRRSLALSVVDGLLYSVMVGVTESYLGALAVELGHRDATLAILATVPLVCGALAQLLSAPLVERFGGPRRFVVAGATVQAATHLAFLLIAATDERRVLPLLVAKIAYWVAAMSVAPAWNSWMTLLTENIPRARYFAWRSAALQGCLLCAFVSAGFHLDGARAAGSALPAFALLASIGLAARLASTFCLAAKFDPTPPRIEGGLPLRARLARTIEVGSFRVPLFIGALMFGAQIAMPFFTPYMLRTLGLGFTSFAWLTAAAILAKAASFPLWRMAAERWGLGVVLVVSAAGMAIVPLLWAREPGYAGLVFVQMASGFAWGGYEFATLQILMHQSPKELGVEYFSIASTMSGVAQVLGSLTGSFLLSTAFLDYQGVFIVSAVGRGLALLLVVRGIRES
jgi:MFS family permease